LEEQMEDHTEALEPLVVSLQEAERITGHGKTRLYEELAKGSITAKKSGARTLIVLDSLRKYIEALPHATFRKPVPKSKRGRLAR
jgi:hypothetical protein